MSIEYKLVILDRKFFGKDKLIMYLYDCYLAKTRAVINLLPEGPSAQTSGLYNLLDNFCDHTGYEKTNITLMTANMIEHHDSYNIVKNTNGMFYLNGIIKWAKSNNIEINARPTKHFGNFIGRSNWNRLWISTLINTKYADKSIQTFNSSPKVKYMTKESDDAIDYMGLEDLVKFECDIIPEVSKFLDSCPILLDQDHVFIRNCPSEIIKTDRYYPLYHPANLNITHFYQHFFVDIVVETHVSGECFFMSEKTFRPFIAKRPFIIMGPRHYLLNLKKLGFKTFNNLWDEGYDEYENNFRIQQIDQLMTTISQWSLEKIHAVLEEMQEILNHNYDTFMNLTHTKIKSTFND